MHFLLDNKKKKVYNCGRKGVKMGYQTKNMVENVARLKGDGERTLVFSPAAAEKMIVGAAEAMAGGGEIVVNFFRSVPSRCQK